MKFRRDKEVVEIEDFVRNLNELNESHDILDKNGYRLSNLYCRIFNTDLTHGGRYYRADILNIDNSDNYRLDITMDGESVVEVDYSGLHIHIAAAENGTLEHLPDDPYSLVGVEGDRKVVKLATNIMLNCRSKRSAVAAINRELERVKSSYTSGVKLYEDIHSAFSFVGDVFGRQDSYGLYLQSQDSKLATKVMEPFLEMNMPILPVHDSFITKQRMVEVLCWKMGEAFRETFGTECWVPVKVCYKDKNGTLVEEKKRV